MSGGPAACVTMAGRPVLRHRLVGDNDGMSLAGGDTSAGLPHGQAPSWIWWQRGRLPPGTPSCHRHRAAFHSGDGAHGTVGTGDMGRWGQGTQAQQGQAHGTLGTQHVGPWGQGTPAQEEQGTWDHGTGHMGPWGQGAWDLGNTAHRHSRDRAHGTMGMGDMGPLRQGTWAS